MIQMIGIDYTTAAVDTRSIFAFRKSELPELMRRLREKLGATGVVLLSTCNRMEVWVSSRKPIPDILEELCQIRSLRWENYRDSFVSRSGETAAKHLFLLTAGLKSAIVAEDQILSQVKEAEEFARLNKLIDSPLEVLFRCAVTAAKRVKTEVVFHRGSNTAIEKAICLIEKEYFSLRGKEAMVIGNGEYGRLAASRLLEAGAKVTVTIRQYHSGEVRIPEGASAILYGEKYRLFPQCDLVVSATSSPNYTLFYDKVARCENHKQKILIDLAVPRDIEPEIGKLPGYVLYDIDDFQNELGQENQEAFLQAEHIIEEALNEFRVWISFRDVIPMINSVKEAAAREITARLERPLQKLDADQRDSLKKSIEDASSKVVANIFYDLRDTLEEDVFRACLQAAAKQGGKE